MFLKTTRIGEQTKELLGGKEAVSEIPGIKRIVGRPLLGERIPSERVHAKQVRNRLNRVAHLKYGYKLMEISRELGLHFTTVGKVTSGPEILFQDPY